MATFSIFVQHECIGSPVIAELIRFCESALESGHKIDHIFFYQDALYALSTHRMIPTDELDWLARLEQLATKLAIDMLFCTTAAERRGIVDIAPIFNGAGLAEFAMRADRCDRVIGF